MLRGLALGSLLLDHRDNIIRVFAGTTVQFAHSHMWTHRESEEGGGGRGREEEGGRREEGGDRVTGDATAVPL